MRLDAPPYAHIAPPAFKRSSGYGYGRVDSFKIGLAKWLPPAKSGARSGAHPRPGAQALISKFHTFPAEQDSAYSVRSPDPVNRRENLNRGQLAPALFWSVCAA
jgi:hypothetical protein